MRKPSLLKTTQEVTSQDRPIDLSYQRKNPTQQMDPIHHWDFGANGVRRLPLGKLRQQMSPDCVYIRVVKPILFSRRNRFLATQPLLYVNLLRFLYVLHLLPHPTPNSTLPPSILNPTLNINKWKSQHAALRSTQPNHISQESLIVALTSPSPVTPLSKNSTSPSSNSTPQYISPSQMEPNHQQTTIPT